MTSPQIILHWFVGFFAAVLFIGVIFRFIENLQQNNRHRSVRGVAFVSGVTMSLGVSPRAVFAAELADLTQIVPPQYPAIIRSFVTFNTVVGVLFGLLVIWDQGGWFAVVSFALAFVAGLWLLYSPILSMILLFIGMGAMMLAPIDQW